MAETDPAPSPECQIEIDELWWQDAETACPTDATLVGQPPPVPPHPCPVLGLEAAFHLWCEKPDGTRHGRWMAWLSNGKKSSTEESRDGLPFGVKVWWHRNGAPSAIKSARRSIQCHADGTLRSVVRFNDKKHRMSVEEYDHGKLISSCRSHETIAGVCPLPRATPEEDMAELRRWGIEAQSQPGCECSGIPGDLCFADL